MDSEFRLKSNSNFPLLVFSNDTAKKNQQYELIASLSGQRKVLLTRECFWPVHKDPAQTNLTGDEVLKNKTNQGNNVQRRLGSLKTKILHLGTWEYFEDCPRWKRITKIGGGIGSAGETVTRTKTGTRTETGTEETEVGTEVEEIEVGTGIEETGVGTGIATNVTKKKTG